MSYHHLRDDRPRARQRHRCGLCQEAIEVGEQHVARTGVECGGVYTFRMHTECEAATHDWDEGAWATWDPEGFREDYAPKEAADAAE